MHYYDHGLLGATLAVGSGAPRRLGGGSVVLAALIAMVPDWDALSSHVSTETYHGVHRVWGHNLFAVAILGAALGTLGWWIQWTANSRAGPAAPPRNDLRIWLALGTLIMLSHVLMDVIYCGGFDGPAWPVQLLWPVTSAGLAYPCVPWVDWLTTLILAIGLLATLLARRHARAIACLSLLLLAGHVLCRRLWG